MEQYVQKEHGFLVQYPIPRVREELVNTCGSLILGDQVDSLRTHFRTLLQDDDRQQLQGLYASLTRIPGGVELVCNTFRRYVMDVGLAATTALVAILGELPRVNPQAYVDTLLGARDTCTEVLESCFRSDVRLASALDEGQATLVNCNTVTGSSKQASCQLLVDCADALLQNAVSYEATGAKALDLSVDRVVRNPLSSSIKRYDISTCSQSIDGIARLLERQGRLPESIPAQDVQASYICLIHLARCGNNHACEVEEPVRV